MTHDEKQPCEYCTPKTTIRNTAFHEHIPSDEHDKRGRFGGCLALRSVNGKHFIHYENSADVFYTEVELAEKWPIKHCPMCGRKL